MQANPSPRKTLLIDRDGTLVREPPETLQVSSLEQLCWMPGAITALHQLWQAGYALIWVSNQDALGTEGNPLANYQQLNEHIFALLRGEGVEFAAGFTCPHTAEQRCDCRKPKTGLVEGYLRQHPLLLSDSFVIGDRATDCQFAANLGIGSFLLQGDRAGEDPSLSVEQRRWRWGELVHYLLERPRSVRVVRQTKETDIALELCLDAPQGQGRYEIHSGLHFLDHMLEQLSRHGGMDLRLSCRGDLHVDAHHTVEDVALALGQAFAEALGDKRGIVRYSWERILVMDEVCCEVSLDLSGRPYLVFEVEFPLAQVGDLPTEMVRHFFHSFCTAAKINLHLRCAGPAAVQPNTHHLVEACFKALARCLRDAIRRQGRGISSTKGLL